MFIETLIRILVETIYNVMTGDSIKTKIIVKVKNWCYSNDFLDFLKNKKTGKNSYPQFWWQFFMMAIRMVKNLRINEISGVLLIWKQNLFLIAQS